MRLQQVVIIATSSSFFSLFKNNSNITTTRGRCLHKDTVSRSSVLSFCSTTGPGQFEAEADLRTELFLSVWKLPNTHTHTHAHTKENRLSNNMAKEVRQFSRVYEGAGLVFQAK